MSGFFNAATNYVDGILYNGATIDTSNPAIGGADLSLNAANAQYMNSTAVLSAGPVATGSGFTVTAWFNPSGFPAAGAYLFDLSGTTTTIGIYFDTSSTLTAVYNGTTVKSSYTILPNIWHFVALTVFCTASSTALQSLYVDTNAAVTVNTANYVIFSTTNTTLLGGGQSTVSGGWVPNYYFNGKLDDVRMYGRALTPPEVGVVANYNYANGFISGGMLTASASYDISYATVVKINVSGLFSGLNVVRTPGFPTMVAPAGTWTITGSNLSSTDGINWSFVDPYVISDTSYSYQITPYALANVGRTTVSLGPAYTTPIINGFFNLGGVPAANATGTNASLVGWSVSLGTSSIYYLCNGTGVNSNGTMYSGKLPSNVSYYLAVNMTAVATTTVYQSVPIYTNTTGILGFYAWSQDGVYAPSCSLSVSLGVLKLLNNFTFTPGTGIPYISFNLPFSLSLLGNYPLVFTVTSTAATAATICFSGVHIRSQSTPGVGYRVVDPSGLVLYYPLDSTPDNVKLLNYGGGGLGVADATLGVGGGATIQTGTGGGRSLLPLMGTGYLATDGVNGYASLGTWTCPSFNVGSGFTMTGWVYTSLPLLGPSGESTNSVVWSLSNGAGGSVVVYWNQNSLDISFNGYGGAELVTPALPPYTWHQWGVSVVALGNKQGTYTFYLNGTSLGTMYGGWPGTIGGATFTQNYLGGFPSGGGVNGGAGGLPLTNFAGYQDDVRIYNRALTAQDFYSLWSWSFSQNSYTTLVDSSGLFLYYPFDEGSEMYGMPAPAFSVNWGSATLPTLDATGNYTLTAVNSPTLYNDSVRGYVLVCGTSLTAPGCVTFNYSLPTVGAPWSLTAWIKNIATGNGNIQYFSFNNGGITYQDVSNAVQGPSGGFLYGTSQFMPAFNPANTGSWYQAALVYDGTKATSYLNGVPVAVSPGFSLASSSLLGILGGIKVNGVLSGGGGTGYLGPLSVYASALTSNQVAYFYNTSVRR